MSGQEKAFVPWAAGEPQSLAERATEFLTANPKASFLGVAPLFAGYRVVRGPTDWIVVASGEDPQIKLDALHAPRRARRALTNLARTKVPVAALYIAHEVPTGAEERLKTGSILDELRTDPAARNTALAMRLDKVGKAMTGALAGVLAATIAAPVLALAAIDGLDPAVIAAVTASGVATEGELAAFFHIVSWV